MATVDEFCANPWILRISEAKRRKLFRVNDVLTFTRSAQAVKLSAVDSSGIEVLGRPVQLTLGADGKLAVIDYGRQMTFALSAGKLVYEAEYEFGSVHEPDESGEGDPR